MNMLKKKKKARKIGIAKSTVKMICKYRTFLAVINNKKCMTGSTSHVLLCETVAHWMFKLEWTFCYEVAGSNRCRNSWERERESESASQRQRCKDNYPVKISPIKDHFS